MKRMFCVMATYTLLAVSTASANNGSHLFYDFVESSSGDVLATIELASLPAFFGDVESLTFSPMGESLFGFGSTYLSDFDNGGGGPVEDISGGLAGSSFLDFTPPSSSLFPTFTVFSISATLTPGEDAINLGTGGAAPPLRRITGDWTLAPVPEPTSAGLCLTAALIGAGVRRRRRT